MRRNLSQLVKQNNLSIAKFNPTQSQLISRALLHSPKRYLPLFLAMSGCHEWGEPSDFNSEYWIILFNKSATEWV